MLSATNPERVIQALANPDAFYPDVQVEDFQEMRRVPGHAPATLAEQLGLAMRDCNALLADWQVARLAEGLTALPADAKDYYLAAVYDRAYARLLPILPVLAAGEPAREKLVQLAQRPGDWLRSSDANLARVRGDMPHGLRARAELI